VDVPTVLGWMRPVIVLPVAALANLTPNQVEAIIAHELAHIRRHDYAINVLQTLAETLLFYHPCVWWVSARIRGARHCCDDVAIGVCGDASPADALVSSRRSASREPAWRSRHRRSLFRSDRPHPLRETADQSRSPGVLVTLALTAFSGCRRRCVHLAAARSAMVSRRADGKAQGDGGLAPQDQVPSAVGSEAIAPPSVREPPGSA
jgi:hypothetical protein